MVWHNTFSIRQGKNKTKLIVERLEDRTLLSTTANVTFHGGPVAANVQVEAAYYGNYWSTPAGQQQGSQLNTYLGFLVNSSYMDMLNEYGVGRGTLVGNGIAENGLADGQTVDDTQLQQMLDADIAHGNLQATNSQTLYVIFTPPNVLVTASGENSRQNFYGYHDSFTGSSGKRVYYAVIANPAGNGDVPGLSDFQTLTSVTGHEVAEAATDPTGYGWYDSQTGQEIADIAQSVIGSLNGYSVQGEWSQQQHASILPSGTGGPSGGAGGAGAPQVSLTSILEGAGAKFTHSDEYFSNLIVNDYQTLLGRTPQSTEMSYWLYLMKQGHTDEEVLADFLGSPEFIQHAGGTNQAWLTAVYQDLLNRAPDAQGTSYWTQQLNSGASRTSVAHGIAVSRERETNIVAGDYQHYLGRAGSSDEISAWVAALQNGVTNEQIIDSFVASNEFYKNQGSTPEGWVTAIYQTILGRAPSSTEFNYWDNALFSRSVFFGKELPDNI